MPTEAEKEQDQLNVFSQQMLASLDEAESYFWSVNARGGYDTGFKRLTEALEGLQPGLYFVPAMPNIGKTAFCIQLAWQVAQVNDDAFVMYFTLDDPSRVVISRTAAMLSGLPIRAIRNPQAFADDSEIISKRNAAIDEIRENSYRFVIIDKTQDPDVDSIIKDVDRYMVHADSMGSKRKPVIFIDNFHDLSCDMDSESEQAMYKKILQRLKALYSLHFVPIICTAEMRKLNGIRRPILDDVRETSKTGFAMQACMALYNEVGLKRDHARIFWTDSTGKKMPVLEVSLVKNKVSSFKDRIFYKFIPHLSRVEEITDPQTEAHFNSLIRD